MPNKCAVQFSGNQSGTSALKFHRFPKNSQIFELWLSKSCGKKKPNPNIHEFVKNISLHRLSIFFLYLCFRNNHHRKFVHIFDMVSSSRYTWTAIIRKFVSFSGIGELSVLRSHFGSRKIEQHIYLAIFVAEKRKIGMKM